MKIKLILLSTLLLGTTATLAQTPRPTPSKAPAKVIKTLSNTSPKATPAPRAPTPADSSNYTPPTYVSPSKLGGGRDMYDVPKVTPLANKKFYLKNEITLELSFLATDPFEKYLAFGGSYTHAFNGFWGWEVFNGSYALAFDSGLKNDLIGNQGVNPSLIDAEQAYMTSNITVSPLYTKNLLFNASTVYSQFAFAMGGGMAYFVYGGFQPIFDLGIILRYYIGPNSSLKLDFRDYISPNGYTNNNVSITIGYAFDLNSK